MTPWVHIPFLRPPSSLGHIYDPVLKRWTGRVRGAVANGRGHEKVVDRRCYYQVGVPSSCFRRSYILVGAWEHTLCWASFRYSFDGRGL